MNAVEEPSVSRSYYQESYISRDGQINEYELLHGRRVQGSSYQTMAEILRQDILHQQDIARGGADKFGSGAEVSINFNKAPRGVGSVVEARDGARELSGAVDQMADAASNGDKSELLSDVKNFVKAYNNVIVRGGNSSVTSVARSVSWMANTVQGSTATLNTVGVNVEKDGILSLNKEAFDKADKDVMGDVIGRGSELYNRLKDRASAIINNANGQISSLGTGAMLYGSNGMVG